MERTERLLDIMRARNAALDPPERCFLVVDAASDPSIFPFLYAHQDELTVQSLYKGEAAAELAEVAPYLLALDENDGPARKFVAQGWGHHRFILLCTAAGFDDMRQHLRKLTFAQMPDGEAVLFRFYDPRVTRIFLPTCDGAQLARFFGPASRIVTETQDPVRAACFDFRDGRLEAGTIALD